MTITVKNYACKTIFLQILNEEVNRHIIFSHLFPSVVFG